MPETPDRPRRTGLFALDFMIAACAIIVSVASLWVALRADQTQEQLLKSTVWPYIEYDTSDATANGGNRLAFEIQNAGVGPAIVRSFAVAYDGRYYPSLRTLMAACCHVYPSKKKHYIFASTVRDSVIMAHQDVAFIQLFPGTSDPQSYESISRARFHIHVQICYCSVLNDCWFFDSKVDDQPIAVDKCRPAKVPYET
ncbi:MAG TPA: hypothetical protein VMV65_00055 [Alphaproteobacteria bacterium]|nr:hypothetical protein [Alphaproteobacteria bacterium]